MEESIANKNSVLSYIIRGYGKINRLNGASSFYDSYGRPVVIKMQDNSGKEGV